MIYFIPGYIIYYRCHLKEKKETSAERETSPNGEESDSVDEAEVDALLTQMGVSSSPQGGGGLVPSAPPSAEPGGPEPLFPSLPVQHPAIRNIQQQDIEQPPRYSQLSPHPNTPAEHPASRSIQESVEQPPRYSQAVSEDMHGVNTRMSQPPRYSHIINTQPCS